MSEHDMPRRMYADLSWAHPIISPPENYEKEGEVFSKTISAHSRIPIEAVLNLGSGGGNHDFCLRRRFQVTGVDLSPDMIEHASSLNPGTRYHEGDIRTVRLEPESFDAVVCFDSIAYMLSRQDLTAAFETAFFHLKPGGVFLTFTELDPEHFTQNRIQHSVHRRGDTEIVLLENEYDPDPTDTTVECAYVYIIRESGKLRVETDVHLFGMFPNRTWVECLETAGFAVTTLSPFLEDHTTGFCGLKSP